MKESLVWIWFVLILQISFTKETKLLVDLMKHGITAPRYTQNSIYNITGNSYTEDVGELTERGIFQMEQHGAALQNEYIKANKFLPDTFQPENFYQKTYSDQPSVMSAYASMLGAYPDSVSWVEYQAIDSTSNNLAPFNREDETKVRTTMDLSTSPSSLTTRNLVVWSEEEGKSFFNDPASNCPQLQADFDTNLDTANAKYTKNQAFDDLYTDMNEGFGIEKDKLNFKTAHLYLDDYVTSKANGKTVPKLLQQETTDSKIKNYYKTYEFEGKYGTDTNDARVVANNFFNYLITSMYGKVQVDKGNLDNDHYDHLKYAQFIGNENAVVAAAKVLGIPVTSQPDFGSKLRFELYESQGEYFVQSTYDGQPISMGSSSDGIMKYDDFMNYIYKRLYFGNVNNYCRGQETISSHLYPSYDRYEDYLKSGNSEFRQTVSKAAGSETTLRSSSTSSTTSSTSNTGYIQQGFVEIEQNKETPQAIQIRQTTVAPTTTYTTTSSAGAQRVVQPALSTAYTGQSATRTSYASAPMQATYAAAPQTYSTAYTAAPAVVPAARTAYMSAPVQTAKTTQYSTSGAYSSQGAAAHVVEVDFQKYPGWDQKPENT